MNDKLVALAEKRGELKARIAMQRASLADNIWPVATTLGAADRVVEGVHWLKRHPGAVGAAALVLAVTRPRRAWRWAKRGFVLWRGVEKFRSRLNSLV